MLFKGDRIKILLLSRTRERITIFSVLMHLKFNLLVSQETGKIAFIMLGTWGITSIIRQNFHKFCSYFQHEFIRYSTVIGWCRSKMDRKLSHLLSHLRNRKAPLKAAAAFYLFRSQFLIAFASTTVYWFVKNVWYL